MGCRLREKRGGRGRAAPSGRCYLEKSGSDGEGPGRSSTADREAEDGELQEYDGASTSRAGPVVQGRVSRLTLNTRYLSDC